MLTRSRHGFSRLAMFQLTTLTIRPPLQRVISRSYKKKPALQARALGRESGQVLEAPKPMREQQNPNTPDLHQPLLFAPSELLACGLRDAHHHPLVGERTEDGVRSWPSARPSPRSFWATSSERLPSRRLKPSASGGPGERLKKSAGTSMSKDEQARDHHRSSGAATKRGAHGIKG